MKSKLSRGKLAELGNLLKIPRNDYKHKFVELSKRIKATVCPVKPQTETHSLYSPNARMMCASI